MRTHHGRSDMAVAGVLLSESCSDTETAQVESSESALLLSSNAHSLTAGAIVGVRGCRGSAPELSRRCGSASVVNGGSAMMLDPDGGAAPIASTGAGCGGSDHTRSQRAASHRSVLWRES